MAETGVNLAVAVEVGRVMPGSVRVVQVENRAFANIDKKTNVFAASIVEDWLAGKYSQTKWDGYDYF